MRTPIVAGNWKMHTTVAEARGLARALRGPLASLRRIQVILCPPFVSLEAVKQEVAGTPIAVGAQDMHWEAKGAFTGEISPVMLRDLCTHVILGHSERRTYFGETDETVQRKVTAALAHGLTPIVCVGETDAQNRAAQTTQVVKTQVVRALAGLKAEQVSTLVIAYEPVWAIGTGRAATPEQAAGTIGFIRSVVRDEFGAQAAEAVRILYGGSIKPDNWPEMIAQPEVDGGLVGGASLVAQDFQRLCEQTQAQAEKRDRLAAS